MKILLIDVYNYNKGGAETVCFNTGKVLEEQGHEVVYFTLKWKDNNPSPYSKRDRGTGTLMHQHTGIMPQQVRTSAETSVCYVPYCVA